MNLLEVLVRPVQPPEEHRFQQLMQEHHYLGALPKIMLSAKQMKSLPDFFKKSRIRADPERVLAVNRGHWCIENSCHYIIDWNYDENRSRIRKGHGPENITRLRRFAISIIKSKGVRGVARKMRQLAGNVRLIFDYLRMTKNSRARGLPR